MSWWSDLNDNTGISSVLGGAFSLIPGLGDYLTSGSGWSKSSNKLLDDQGYSNSGTTGGYKSYLATQAAAQDNAAAAATAKANALYNSLTNKSTTGTTRTGTTSKTGSNVVSRSYTPSTVASNLNKGWSSVLSDNVNRASTTETQTSTKSYLPSWLQSEYTSMIERAKKEAAKPFEAYTGETAADLVGDELLARSGLKSLIDYTSGLYGQSETELGKLQSGDLESYMNPFMKAIQDDIRRQQAITLAEARASAAGSKGLGNSRFAVLEGQIAGDTQRALNTAQADAFTNAQQQALNVSQGLESLAGSRGTSLGNLYNQLDALGQSERAIEQARLDAAYQEFLREQQDTMTKESWLADILNNAGQLNRITDTTTKSKTTPAGISSTAQKLGADMFKDLYRYQGAYRYSTGGLVRGYSKGGLVEPGYGGGEHVGEDRQGYFLGGLATKLGLAALLGSAGYAAYKASEKPEIETVPTSAPAAVGLAAIPVAEVAEPDYSDVETQMQNYGLTGDDQRYTPQYDPAAFALAFNLMNPEPGDNALAALGKAGLASLGLAEKEREKAWDENEAYNVAAKQEAIKSNILQRLRERQNLTEGKSNAAFVQMVNMLKKMGKTDDEALAMANAIIMGQKAKFTGDAATDQAMIDMINNAAGMFTGKQLPNLPGSGRTVAYDKVNKRMQTAH